MFVPNLGEHICARCFLPINKDANCTFILETDSGEASFCYECGILELSEAHDLDPIATDKFWHDKFQKPGPINEEFNPADIH
jgi:hypothetical protein